LTWKLIRSPLPFLNLLSTCRDVPVGRLKPGIPVSRGEWHCFMVGRTFLSAAPSYHARHVPAIRDLPQPASSGPFFAARQGGLNGKRSAACPQECLGRSGRRGTPSARNCSRSGLTRRGNWHYLTVNTYMEHPKAGPRTRQRTFVIDTVTASLYSHVTSTTCEG